MRAIERVGRLGGVLGEAAIVFMVVSISYDVFMRYVLVAPTIWALEVNTFLLMFLCLLPAADVLQAGTQIQITFFTERLSPRARAHLAHSGDFVALLFCAIMTWKGMAMAWAAYQHNDRISTSLGTPLAIPYLFIPLGFGLLGLTYAARLAAGIARPAPGPPAHSPSESGQQI
jgi:TRAP-type C4-dicarboxylate transport system permease small subunit